MDIFRDKFVCLLCVLVCVFATTQGFHDTRQQQIDSRSRLVHRTPRIRARIRVRPTVILPTRNSVRRNFLPMRPTSSIFQPQPIIRFQNGRVQLRQPSGHNARIAPHASVQHTLPSIPSLSDELSRRQSLNNRAQFANGRRFVVDTAKNPFMRSNSINVIKHQDIISTTNKNSLLKLLEERRPVLRDERDALLIRSHLTELNRLRNDGQTNIDHRLQNQVNHIEQIKDIDIQREVLKIFVKDIVEKSGFLNMDPSTVQDIGSLQSLVDKIQMITSKFTNLENPTVIGQSVLHDPQGVSKELNSAPTPVTFRTTTSRNPSDQRADLRQRILHASYSFDRAAHMPDTRGSSSGPGVMPGDTHTLHGIPKVGMSIFGRSTQPTTTLQSITTNVKRDMVATEPMGGNLAYWSHLSSGLADMLCNLCQQRGVQSCIIRYCTNDVIIESVEPETRPTRAMPEVTTLRNL